MIPFLACGIGVLSLAACETSVMESTESTRTEEGDYTPGKNQQNPLSTTGLSDTDISSLVDSILQDPSINIASIPDYIERQIYSSTIRLFIAAVYDSLGSLHGTELLGHQIVLTRKRAADGHEKSLQHMRGDLDEKILEDVVDRLLENKAVNQTLIPDAVERQLYVNCLKLLFRLMDILAASFRLTVCGHIFCFNVQRSTKDDLARMAAVRASSSLTEVDMKRLQEYARDCGVEDTESTQHSLLQGIFDKPQKDLVANIHMSMYALVLGIIDDLFANTKLELLSDSIDFDIEPSTGPLKVEKAQSRKESKGHKVTTSQNSMYYIPVFTAGVGLGMAIVSLLVQLK